MNYLNITYTDPNKILDPFSLRFKLRTHDVVDKWCERLTSAQEKYQIDDPGRFYGFGSVEDQANNSLVRINQCINVINDHKKIILRRLKSIDDQDTLNYLHHIFETYHGMLDKQTHQFWEDCPISVRTALANLNVLVHRCESVSRYNNKRHVVTYYGLPKTKQFDIEDYQQFTSAITFGTVYLNYVEIGKTLEDLTFDNDQYISDEAFKPWRHYSADFNVQFWSADGRQIEERHAKIKEYYEKHQKFFDDLDLITIDHPYLKCGLIPLADIDEDLSKDWILAEIEKRQWVSEVKLT